MKMFLVVVLLGFVPSPASAQQERRDTLIIDSHIVELSPSSNGTVVESKNSLVSVYCEDGKTTLDMETLRIREELPALAEMQILKKLGQKKFDKEHPVTLIQESLLGYCAVAIFDRRLK